MPDSLLGISGITNLPGMSNITGLGNLTELNNITGVANNLINSLSEAEGTQETEGVQSTGKLSSVLSGEGLNIDNSAFNDILNELINTEQVNGQSTSQLMSGDINNLVTAMVDMSESDLALQFTMQVRNKIIDAYKEIMSMQI